MKKNEPILSYTLRLPAQIEYLDIFINFIEQTSDALNIDSLLLPKLTLVIEELVVNVMHYAYPETDTTGMVELRCGMTGPDLFCVMIRDHGKPFNPLTMKSPGLSNDVEKRKIGGLGIFLVKKNVDQLKYKRIDGANELSFCMNIKLEPFQLSG